jgi:hypothetical protein
MKASYDDDGLCFYENACVGCLLGENKIDSDFFFLKNHGPFEILYHEGTHLGCGVGGFGHGWEIYKFTLRDYTYRL